MVPKKSSYPTLSISAVNREKFQPEWIAGLWTENQFHTRSIQNFACKLHFKLDKDLALSWIFKPEWDIWIFMILNWTGENRRWDNACALANFSLFLRNQWLMKGINLDNGNCVQKIFFKAHEIVFFLSTADFSKQYLESAFKAGWKDIFYSTALLCNVNSL